MERHRGLAPEFPLLNSVDFSKPTDFGPLIALWNARPGAAAPLPKMVYSSAREFFEALTEGAPRLDRVAGERPNLWLYIHGPTHHRAIAAQREAGYLLPAAEAFNAVRALLAHTAGTRLMSPEMLKDHLSFCAQAAAARLGTINLWYFLFLTFFSGAAGAVLAGLFSGGRTTPCRFKTPFSSTARRALPH